MSWEAFVVVGVVCLILLLLFKVIRSMKQLIFGVILIAVVLMLIAKFCPERFTRTTILPPEVIERVALLTMDSSDVKVATGKDGVKTVFLLLDGDWYDVRNFKTLLKHARTYELVTEKTSYTLSKEQMKVIKELFIP